MTDAIPTVEIYRGIAIHDQQTAARISQIVKPAIDRVFALGDDEHALFRVAGDVAEPPEARLLAAAMIGAMHEIAAERRENRPAVDMTRARAAVAGLRTARWRSQTHYCSMLDNSDEVRRRATRRPSPADREEG